MVKISIDPLLGKNFGPGMIKTRGALPSATDVPEVAMKKSTSLCGSWAEFCHYSLDPCGAIP